jgi:hypothetical protein
MSVQSGEAFDLVSQPDEASRALRDTLQAEAQARGALGAICRDALDLITGLLLLRRALIVLMEADGVQALALPYTELALASLVPVRVRHEPEVLPGLLQLLLPGGGLVTVASSAYNEAPVSFDSSGEDEVTRLRAALMAARQALQSQEGRDTVLALIDVTLRR